MSATRWSIVVLPLLLGCHQASGPVRIGLALSLHEAGTAPMRLAAELAVREINTAGGIKGRPLELIERDDYSDQDSAVAAANYLYRSDAVAAIGGAYSGMTLAAAPIYNGGRQPLVQLSPSASSPLLTQAGEFTFRLCPSDLAYGASLASFARAQGYRRAAIIYVNDEYGRGIRRTFVDEFTKGGGQIVDMAPFLASSPDVGAYIDRLAFRKQAQVVILAANQEEGLPALRQLRQAKLNLPILAGDGMVGAERTNPGLMEGVLVSSAYLVGDTGARNRTFVAAYRQTNPDAGPPDQGAAATYDAVYLLARIIAEAGPDRGAVRKALSDVGLTRPAFDGVVGRVSFDSAGDAPSLAVQIGVARGGVLIPAQ